MAVEFDRELCYKMNDGVTDVQDVSQMIQSAAVATHIARHIPKRPK